MSCHGHPEAGFSGLNFWRKPFNPVRKCFRTLLLVRGPHPYLLVADDVKKDDATHKYEWLLQLDTDITLLRQQGSDAILAINDGADLKRLLIRVIPPAEGSWQWRTPVGIKLESYEGKQTPGKGALKGRHLAGKRLVVTCDGVVEPGFKIMILPYREGDSIPATQQTAKSMIITKWSDHQDTIDARMDQSGRSALSLQ